MTNVSYSLVLLGRFPGKDRAVAQALSRDFGRDESWGMQVVGAAPIVLIDNLNEAQGDAVHEALAEVEAAGCRFEVQTGGDAGLAKISWPGPPRVRGRLITEMGVAPPAAPLMGNSSTLIVTCPYTGQPMKLTITVRAERMAGIAPVAPAAAPAPAMIPLPASTSRASSAAVQIPYNPVKTPVHTPAPQRQSVPVAAKPAPAPQARAQTATSVATKNDEPIIVGLDSLDDLVAAPLPDVPVLRTSPPKVMPPPQGGAQPMAPNTTPLPDNLMNVPMDLSAFEAGVEGSGIMKAYSAPTGTPAAGVLPEESESQPIEDDGSLCSVTMGKNGNRGVHEMLAEMTGISVDEAARLCQKPIITLAKDISVPDAEAIKQQFATLKVNVRVTKRK